MNTTEVKKMKRKLYLFLLLINLVLIFSTYKIMPIIQNYPPNSENVAFQKSVEQFSHIEQYLVIFIVASSLQIYTLNMALKKIFSFLNKYYKKENISYDEIKKVRKDCINVPYKFYIYQMLIVLFLGMAITLLLISDGLAILKFFLMLFAITSLIEIIQFIIIQRELKKVMIKTYDTEEKYEKNIGIRLSFSTNLILQIIPFIAVSIIIISLIGYAKATEAYAKSNANYYEAYLNNKTFNNLNIDTIKEELETIPLLNDDDYFFIISPNYNEVYVSKENTKITDFFKKYLDRYFIGDRGIVYEFYGTEQQAFTLKLYDENTREEWYIGFEYSTTDKNLMGFYITIIIGALLIYTIFIYILAKNISNNIVDISNSLKNIVEKNNGKQKNKLPILSNDEIGDLSYYYNKIEELTIKNIEQIHNNQEMLMEKERLASLGQLIGGIAHNLKTPIMSIAGAAEGLNDLAKEYDTSIEDPEVNFEDHHAIAKDMYEWIDKVKTHTAYMSDVITAVKGQAVALSSEQVSTFTMEELIKHVNILMRHELKNALVDLNVSMQVEHNLEYKGNINSLVQVINNMISNAIQAYNGKTGQVIDLIIEKENNKLIISIKDYGPGMSKNVKDKLFKEMITTKGKNGTGLGLFMSYSNIRAHFNGNIIVDSELGKGTTFNIILPLN